MRRYETIFITHPELPEENHAELQQKLRSIVQSLKGDFIKLDDWGTKKLSYEIGKNARGRYFLMDYLGGPDLVRELERSLRLNDGVLKFQTVKVSDQISLEAAKALKEAAPVEKAVPVVEQPRAPEQEQIRPQEDTASEGGKVNETST